ncbi:MAG: OmpH family outer membrane protein [Flavobacteriales bacterium TMED191]|nr:MAG: OmpH family outer membrane protein [Flavobacteriales bacterium TMED191]|tara:strand:- start:831 stop:1331 length:501 start_codon:yes stop_codon:yes gene_type:complete
MKHLIFIIGLFTSLIHAQNIAYVDSRYILDNIPEFNAAQEELNNLSIEWQEEIDLLKNDVEKLYRTYQAEQYLLPEEKKKQREELIILKEKEVKILTKQRFGPDGDLYNRQQALIQPIQELIYTAINEFADEAKYDIIFDKSSELIMLFSHPELDKSDEIIEKLGY